MAMSVGTCECGCGEFDHGVGGWEELEEHEHDRWQKHRCDPACVSPCLVARCRESDGFWTWCPNCDILCSGWFEEWSDEPHEEGVGIEELDSETDALSDERWPPKIGARIYADFSEEGLTVMEYAVLDCGGNPVRQSWLDGQGAGCVVYACYAETEMKVEVLIFPDDIV